MKTLIVLAILAKIVLGEDGNDDKIQDEYKDQVDVDLGTVIGIDLGTTYSW